MVTWKHLFRLSGRGRSCLGCTKHGMFGLGIVLKEIHSGLSNPVLIRIRIVPRNVIMVATDMYGKSPYVSGYMELCKSMAFLPFLFLIINFYNFCYIFTFHHCSVICWDFILRLMCLDICIIFLFVSVIILFFTTMIDMELLQHLDRSFLWQLSMDSSRCFL